MTTFSKALLPLLLLAPGFASASFGPFLCETSSATGYAEMDGTIAPVTVQNEDKYLIKKMPWPVSKQGDTYVSVTRIGEQHSRFRCLVHDNDDLICSDDLMGEFKMSPDSMRFIYAYMNGYVEQDMQTSQPFLAIGTCKPIK